MPHRLSSGHRIFGQHASATECASAITRDEMIRRYIAYFNIPAPDEYCTFDTPGMRDAWLAYENPP